MGDERRLPMGASGNAPVPLDDIDKRIIAELQVDGRMPFSTLAPLVGLSDAATRQRVNRLTERGVMSIVAITDARALGFGFQALVGVDVVGDPTEIAAAFEPIPEVTYIVIVAGRYNLLIELVCVDAEHLLELTTMISRLPGVVGTETMTFLRRVKIKYDWGAR
jgi:Lrp/AsnC family transcriptional regulator, regulator for asnA, asnC and gidA